MATSNKPDTPPETVYLLLGSNMGDRRSHLTRAIEAIRTAIGNPFIQSGIYETEAWGFEHQPSFLNQVIGVHTTLPPGKLMQACLCIEKTMGRKRRSGKISRIIDIDILFYGSQIVRQKKCTIPHPRMHLRNFTLVPLSEVAPDWIHPEFNLTMAELLKMSTDKLKVKKIESSTCTT